MQMISAQVRDFSWPAASSPKGRSAYGTSGGAMSRYLSVSRNPWDSTVLQGISLGSMDSAIELARRTEHLPPSGGTDGGEATNMPSVRMIRQLKDITRLRKELNALELEIRDRQFDQATADVVHLDVLEERNAKLEQLSAQLTDILQRKEELVTRLSKPFTGDHIEMDASCHKYAAEVIQTKHKTGRQSTDR